ncbi:class IV adenylate cyclase [Candidatus Babeliales bacterium]|nr:class IV adenylate cyclase [Candidatus Babeliales bacterium]
MKIYEVEMKLQLDAEQMALMHAWLAQHTQLEPTQMLHDYYFDNPYESFFFDSPHGFIEYAKLVRVRQAGQQAFVTSKVRTFDEQLEAIVSCQECETQVVDGQAMMDLFLSLGYIVRLIVEKRRTVCRVGEFEVAFDELPKLGSFVEIELKDPQALPGPGMAKIHDFLKKIGFSRVKTLSRGYLNILLNPGHNFAKMLDL